MKFSIITPTLNSEKTIKSTLLSILGQTYNNIEHIVIDGGSKDETLKIIKKISPKTIIIKQNGKGIYNALNQGVLFTSGDYFCILNSDDVFEKNTTIQKIYNTFNNNSEIDLIYGNLVYVSEKDKIIRNWLSKNLNPKTGKVPPHPSCFYRSKCFKNILYKTSFIISGDFDFLLRVFLNPKINKLYYDDVFIRMRLGGISNKSLMSYIISFKEDIIAFKLNGLSFGFARAIIKKITKTKQWTF